MKAAFVKLLGALTALCLLLSLTVLSAVAEDSAKAPALAASPWTDQTNVSIRETFKTLESETSNIAGAVTYAFTLKAVDDIPNTEAARWDSGENGYVGYPNAVTTSVTLPNGSSNYTSDDGISTAELSTGSLFQNPDKVQTGATGSLLTFPHAGVYLYEVAESAYTYDRADNRATEPAAHGTDPQKYTMKVFVINDDDLTSSDLHITNIVVRNEAGEKVNYADDTSEKNGFAFTNKYYPESNGTLTLKKALEKGEGEDAAEVDDTDLATTFEYTVTIRISDTIAAETGFGLPTDVANLQDLTIRYLEDDEGKPATLISGKAAVSANQPVVLQNLPVGATFAVEETDRNVGDDSNTATQYYSEQKTVTGELTSDNHNPDATITNKKMRELVPTGLTAPLAVSGILTLAALGILTLLLVSRRRSAA